MVNHVIMYNLIQALSISMPRKLALMTASGSPLTGWLFTSHLDAQLVSCYVGNWHSPLGIGCGGLAGISLGVSSKLSSTLQLKVV